MYTYLLPITSGSEELGFTIILSIVSFYNEISWSTKTSAEKKQQHTNIGVK